MKKRWLGFLLKLLIFVLALMIALPGQAWTWRDKDGPWHLLDRILGTYGFGEGWFTMASNGSYLKTVHGAMDSHETFLTCVDMARAYGLQEVYHMDERTNAEVYAFTLNDTHELLLEYEADDTGWEFYGCIVPAPVPYEQIDRNDIRYALRVMTEELSYLFTGYHAAAYDPGGEASRTVLENATKDDLEACIAYLSAAFNMQQREQTDNVITVRAKQSPNDYVRIEIADDYIVFTQPSVATVPTPVPSIYSPTPKPTPAPQPTQAPAPAPTTPPTPEKRAFNLSLYMESVGYSGYLKYDYPYYQYSGRVMVAKKADFDRMLSAMRAYGMQETCLVSETKHYYEGHYVFTSADTEVDLHYYESLNDIIIQAAYRRSYSYPKAVYDPGDLWLPDMEEAIAGAYPKSDRQGNFTQTGGSFRFRAYGDKDALAQALDYVRQYQATEEYFGANRYAFTAENFRLTLEKNQSDWIEAELTNTRPGTKGVSGGEIQATAQYKAQFVSCQSDAGGALLRLTVTETGGTGGSAPFTHFQLTDAGKSPLPGGFPMTIVDALGNAFSNAVTLRSMETATLDIRFAPNAAAQGVYVNGVFFWLDTCAYCQGDGDCKNCFGGDCSSCGGDGYLTSGSRCLCGDGKCFSCRGNGKCWYCKGTGRN